MTMRRTHRSPFLSSTVLVFLLTQQGLMASVPHGEALNRIKSDWDAYVYATGLSSPDGLAIHPATRELYCTEETAGRVSVIRDGKALPVVTSGFSVSGELPDWAVDGLRTREVWSRRELREPEGLAFGPDGTLYVLEDVADGRLLSFKAQDVDRYRDAVTVPVPWASGPYAWEGVSVAANGRIYVAGSTMEAGDAFRGGAVMARDADGDWWVVDYGPFASFSTVGLSRDEDILLVGDEATGAVTWWDILRQREIDTVVPPQGAVEGVCVLPDGRIVVAQESTENGEGRLMQIDPTTGECRVLAKGFATIESVIVDEQTGYVYVSEDGTGSIIELRPREPFATNEYLLQRAATAAATSKGFAPKKWPPFLKKFFNNVGVRTKDENLESMSPLNSQGGGTESDKAVEIELTMEELGERVPMVAGKVTFSDQPSPEDPDPVRELNFIHFYPGQMTLTGRSPTPSFALFAARHHSGKIDRTRPLLGYSASRRDDQGNWTKISDNSSLFLPLTSCSAVRRGDTVTLTMCFLGLGETKDYYLTLNCGRRNSGSLTTSKGSVGAKLVSREADFVEVDEDGKEVVNVVMTGFVPRNRDEIGWFKLGKHNRWAVATPEREMWLSRWIRRNMPMLADSITRQEKSLFMAMKKDGTYVPDMMQAQRSRPGADADKKTAEGPSEAPVDEARSPVAPPLQDAEARAVPNPEKAPAQAAVPAVPETPAQAAAPAAEEAPAPVAIKIPAPQNDADDFQSLTNILLSRVAEAWEQTPF